MLALDLSRMTHAELADAVAERCGRFGNVKGITILQPPEKPEIAFALVGMAADDEIDNVVANLGAAKVASLAVIRIEPPLAPAALSRKVQPDWPALV